jgi:alkaline phosphatase D
VASFICDSLLPSTTYAYSLELNGVVGDKFGSFKTFPSGPSSFSFVVSSCCHNSNHPVYNLMKEKNPLFYINTGDLHYADPVGTSLSEHVLPYETEVLSKEAAADFFKQVPLVYMWDDHDFCGDGSNKFSPGRDAAKKAYELYVPHYPLIGREQNDPIFQSFKVGRVRFLLSDVRSARTENTILGSRQMEWLKKEMAESAKNGELIVWITSVSFNGNRQDNWGGYEPERIELSNFFLENNISNMMILCGDAHMLAIDDGTHSDYSTKRKNPNQYPIIQASALNSVGSYKGGEFSEGTFPNPSISDGQFANITIEDDGVNEICVRVDGYRINELNKLSSLITEYNFCRKVALSGQMRMFPNPAYNNVTFQFKDVEVNASSTLTLFNLLGELAVVKSFKPGNDLSYVLDVEGLNEGLYIGRVKVGNRTFGIELVILR